MKKFFKKLKKKFKPLLLIPIVLVVALLAVGGYFIFFNGDDDDSKTTASTTSSSSSKGDPDAGPSAPLKKPDAPKLAPEKPTGKEFTIDSDRDEKSYALAQATGSIKTPARIALRLGAAPKQPVTVNWNIVCLLPTEGAKTTSDTFQVTPPHMRDLKLPVNNAVTCTASANAQLTQAGKGRIKVFLVGTRRADG